MPDDRLFDSSWRNGDCPVCWNRNNDIPHAIKEFIRMPDLGKPVQKLKIVVIGGVAGGASAATRARRVNAEAEITIIEKGPVVSFANCGLPYHVGGEIPTRQSLSVAKKEMFWNRFRIAIQTQTEVTSIDRNDKAVTVVNLETNETSILHYDRLIIATGAEPNVPDYCKPMPSNAFHLWTLNDMDRVLEKVNGGQVAHAVVVGGGFVGLEVVEQLHRRGIHVTLVERNPQVLTRLDPIFARMVETHLQSKSIALQLGNPIVSLKMDGDQAKTAVLADGMELPLDLLVVGAGVTPRIALAERCGLSIGDKGGVQVNDFMQTSDPNIYAVGDIVEYENAVTKERGLNPLAGPANRSGRIAGAHAASGASEPMGPVLGTSIVRVFDLTAACTGLNEKQLQSRRTDFRTAIVQAASHASYFPGAQSMQLKLLYSPHDGKIFGAQAVGGEGVDKRIDVIATAIFFSASVYQLAQLDLAYAPPYGSAKDPIHMAAFTACNDLNNLPKLKLPTANLDGLQVARIIRSELAAPLNHLPIVGLTASSHPNDHAACRAAGMNAVVLSGNGAMLRVGQPVAGSYGFE
jgi:NADPH-dependent 2,4-dienoyl-CoA reductase/sulfur reductase-like enzyme